MYLSIIQRLPIQHENEIFIVQKLGSIQALVAAVSALYKGK